MKLPRRTAPAGLLLLLGAGFNPAFPAGDVPSLQREVRALTAELDKSLTLAAPEGRRLRAAVIEFEDVTPGAKELRLGRILSDLVSARLVERGRIEVIERSRLNAALAEQRLGLTGVIDPDSAKKVGRILSADVVLCGAVSELGDFYDLSVRAIDTEKGRVVAAAVTDIPRETVEGSGAGTAPDDAGAAPRLQRGLDTLEAALVVYGNTNVKDLMVVWPPTLEALVPKYLSRLPSPLDGKWLYDPKNGTVRHSAHPDLKPSQPRLHTQPLLDHARKAGILSQLQMFRRASMMYQAEYGKLAPDLKALAPYLGEMPDARGGSWAYDPKTGKVWNTRWPEVTIP